MPHTTIRTSYDLGPEGRILIASLESDPAAGAEISVTVPGRAVWHVHAIRFTLVTDATVDNRIPILEIDDGQNIFASIPPPSVQTASITRPMSYYVGSERNSSFDASMMMPLPHSLIMLPGWRIRTSTVNLQAGDNYSAPVLYIRETPQRGIDAGQDALLSALRRLIDREV